MCWGKNHRIALTPLRDMLQDLVPAIEKSKDCLNCHLGLVTDFTYGASQSKAENKPPQRVGNTSLSCTAPQEVQQTVYTCHTVCLRAIFELGIAAFQECASHLSQISA